MSIAITADFSEFDDKLKELALLVESLDHVPDSLVSLFHASIAHINDEIIYLDTVPASVADEYVIRFGVLLNGRLDACIAAALALRGDLGVRY